MIEYKQFQLIFVKIIKPTPVTDKVIEVDVAPMITILSTDSKTVFIVSHFLYIFLDLLFLSLKYVIISLMLLIELMKLLTSLNLFSILRSKSSFLFFSGADGYNLSHF